MPGQFSNDDLLAMLEEMISGRNDFFTSGMIRNIPFQFRNAVMTRYMSTEALYLDLMSRIYTSNLRERLAATTLLTFSMPINYNDGSPSFMEPVIVVPSQTQINSSLEECPGNQSSCAVCQDTISSGACRIRQCGHVYHRTCIVNWFSMSVRCPVCRFDIRQADPLIQTSSASEQTLSQQEDL
jgi:hypothetical protein